MKVLIIGSSGSGKTFLTEKFREKGFNAFDADEIEGLHGWYNWKKEKVKFPREAGADFMDNHEFLWNREVLKSFLDQHEKVFIFGMSGNVLDVRYLFDKVYHLKVPGDILIERLDHPTRTNPMGKTEYQKKLILSWEEEINKVAQNMNAIPVDGTLPTDELIEILT